MNAARSRASPLRTAVGPRVPALPDKIASSLCASFGHLADGGTRIQFYVRQDDFGPERYESFKSLDLGDFIEVGGLLFRTRTGEVTVHAEDIVLLSKTLLPMPEKFHGLKETEARYRVTISVEGARMPCEPLNHSAALLAMHQRLSWMNWTGRICIKF